MTDNMQRARERISDMVLEVLACEPCIGTYESEESFAHRIAVAAAMRLAAPEEAVEQLTESEKDVALGQAVEFAEYVERQAKGTMRDAAKRFLSLPYSQQIAERLAAPTVSAEGEG